MGTPYGVIADTFRDIGDLMMQQQKFNAEMKDREQKFALQSQLQTEQLKDQLQQRQLTQYKIDEIERYKTPTSFNLYQIAPATDITTKHVYGNPDVMNKLARVLDPQNQYGLTFSPADGGFRSRDGDEFLISPEELSRKAPGLIGIIQNEVDPMEISKDKIAGLESRRQKLTKDLAAARQGSYKKQGPAVLKIAGIKQALRDVEEKIITEGDNLAPEKMLENYRELKNMNQQWANWALSNNDTNLANYFQDAMGKAADMEKTALNAYWAKGSTGEKLMKMAVVIRDGVVVPGSQVLVPVNKNASGGLIPQHFAAPGQDLTQHVWLEGNRTGGDGSGGTMGALTSRTKAASNFMDSFYQGVFQENLDGSNTFYPDPTVAHDRAWAQKLLGPLLNADTETNFIILVNQARNIVKSHKVELLQTIEAVINDEAIVDKQGALREVVNSFSGMSGLSKADMMADPDNILNQIDWTFID